MSKELDELCINTIRMLSADAVEQAKSGHPGLPMGAAAFAYTLWIRHLRFNPKNPEWLNRDRFVLSAGHGSMLLYSLLHLTGYDLPLKEIKRFRQWNSQTPGHPEHGLTPGVETTTGPLGQGATNAVGMALAEQFLAKRYNRPGHEIIDYRTYALVSDGDLMEGIASEAASFAGSARLSKLTYLYDSNNISIEGSTDLTFQENVAKRFEAYGWHTVTVEDGNNIAAVDKALQNAKKDSRPSFILLKTHIGFGSPNKRDTAGAHGSPLGKDELKATKKNLNWPLQPQFYIPQKALKKFRQSIDQGAKLEKIWTTKFKAYKEAFPELAAELQGLFNNRRSDAWQQLLPPFSASDQSLATREASGKVMNAIAPALPLFVGGSADLGPSNNTALKDFGDITGSDWPDGARNLHFGVREHAMAGILNGLALSKAIIPYGGTFLIFSDYMRAAMRLAALMRLQVIYVLTHDSIGQGEDGATHQPVEQLAALRAIPNMTVIRPSDATETVEAWRQALLNANGPTALALTRQKLPVFDRTKLASANNLRYGGYVIKDCNDTPDILLIATGSEVSITLESANLLSKQAIKARVISMPSTDLFEQQSQEYKDSVLLPDVPKRLAVEAASAFGWDKYVGPHGATLCLDEFGASAPGAVMMEQYGFTPENVAEQAVKLLAKPKEASYETREAKRAKVQNLPRQRRSR